MSNMTHNTLFSYIILIMYENSKKKSTQLHTTARNIVMLSRLKVFLFLTFDYDIYNPTAYFWNL